MSDNNYEPSWAQIFGTLKGCFETHHPKCDCKICTATHLVILELSSGQIKPDNSLNRLICEIEDAIEQIEDYDTLKGELFSKIADLNVLTQGSLDSRK